jgi:hypothetical protein
MRILTIMARHGLAKYGSAVEELRAWQHRSVPHAACELLVVDNALTAGAAVDGGAVIPGSNRAWEFSAWDEGLAHVEARILEYDLVHLVTSAFNTLYTRYLDRLDEAALGLVVGRAVAVGHVDRYDQPIELLGNPSQHWLRSSFVFLPPTELALLGPLAALGDPGRFFSGVATRPFRDDAPISENYRRYILDWLTGEGTGQGTTWHSRFQLDAESLPYFEAKASAILNEQLLSIRLRRGGCSIVDATWLGTQARRQARTLSAIPGWKEQLAGRDTDAVSFGGVPS